MNTNTGHGHVHPRPDGAKARCGGPGLCTQCSREKAALNTPASTASAITDEQILTVVRPHLVFMDGPYGSDSKDVVRAVRAVLALAAPTTQPTGQTVEPSQPAADPQEAVLRFAIDVEKMLCAKLGREWSAAGISIVTLIDALASCTPTPAAPRSLEWAEGGLPDCNYSHVHAMTPFGRVLITWKAHKEFPSFSADEFPCADGYLFLSSSSVQEAKADAERAYFAMIDAAIASSTKASGGTEQ